MHTFLGSFASHFGKHVVLGTFLPVTMFLGLWILLVEPFIPPTASGLRRLELPSEAWHLVSIAFLGVFLTAVLYNFNYTLVRWLEGYPWANSLAGQWKIDRYGRRRQRLQTQSEGILAVVSTLENSPEKAELELRLSEILRTLRMHFPDPAFRLLPTRLGNIIRAFESYPNREYGLDGVTLWPALTAVMSKDQLELVSDARTEFNFTINLVALAGGSAALALGYGAYLSFFFDLSSALPLWLTVASFTLLTLGVYRMSQDAALAWGDTVRRAYDLNRRALWAQYGVPQVPTDIKAERELGEALSRQLLYGDRRAYDNLTDATPEETPNFPPSQPWPKTAARSSHGTDLIVSRSVQSIAPGHLRIHLKIHPLESYIAEAVVVQDTLPQLWGYVTDSGKIDAEPMDPTGTNPYLFTLGDVAPGEQRIVEYEAIRLHG